MSNEVQVVVTIPAADLDAAYQFAEENDVRIERIPTRGIDPISGITIILLGASLAVATVRRLIEERAGGQVIDLRAGHKQIYRSKDLVYGMVLIIANDGSATVQVLEPKGMLGTIVEALSKIPTEIAKAGINAITEHAQDQVGAAAEISFTTSSGDIKPD